MPTSKSYKAAQLIGVLLLLIGIALMTGTELTSHGALLLVVGSVLYALGRVLAWWQDK